LSPFTSNIILALPNESQLVNPSQITKTIEIVFQHQLYEARFRKKIATQIANAT
jgi:hypothetical protein